MILSRLLTNLRSTVRVMLCASFILLMSIPASAQRFTDNLDRGLVAVKLADNGNSIGTLVSWRRLSTEYFDVTYNLYYNGTLLAQNINNTNYAHGHSITGAETYEVAAVVRGVEQKKCDPVRVWPGWQYYRNGDRYAGGYMDIPLGEIHSRGNQLVTDSYWANDIEVADLDGDGEMEFIIKRMNMDDANALYENMTDPAYDVIEAYEFDGTRLWWIDVGANMVSGNSTETNVIAFDWDEDGAAEVILRGADDMVIHYMENGVEKTQNIGTYGLSTRNTVYHAANGTYTNTGNEYLIYLNGATGKPYPIGNNTSQPWITYPLPRLEQGETDVAEAWWYSAQYTGTGKPGILGHRDSKYFMGAPYLDGQHPSLFLGRGIYTRHKMIAMNVDPSTHKLSELWRWNCNDRNSPWFGNGYHNFVIADVDEDGRDEIVYGSMVIDDNGNGLHTTGLGHGDAQHVSDFNPWRKGLEFFGCLEESGGSNYRDATTGEILYRYTQTGDDGRALMANFSNNYPGCYGRSSGGAEFSSVTNELISGLTETLSAGNLNFRIYWDGDLLSEWQDAAGSENGYITVDKPGRGRIFNASGTAANNSTKHNTCFQGDIIGDWREEFIARVDARTIRLYTTGVYSEFSLPSLWYDHQYRQAMATQEMVYNLPPHLSYFIGELEGYTVAPPPLTTRGRQLVGNGGTIGSSFNGEQVLACETSDMTISVSNGAQPWVFIDNAPSWVQGHNNNNNITTETYTHTLTGGAFTGGMHLVKQGDGKLILPSVTETYTGNTDVWAGTLQFDGTMQNSPVWMNRHTTLNTTGGTFTGGLTMEYGSALNIGGETSGTISTTTVSDLTLNYGSQVMFDVAGTDQGDNDLLTVNGTLTIDKKTGDNWTNYGPENLVPVFVLRSATELESGDYPIAVVEAFGNDADTDIANIKLNTDELECSGAELVYDSSTKILYLHIAENAMPAYGGDLSIDVTDMVPYQVSATDYPSAADETFYLPIVSVNAPAFNGVTPTVTGTFTPLDGTSGTTINNISSYTFTEPGTLTVKASASGYKSKTETYTVSAVYYKYYESPDYNEIAAADAASVLGSDYWNEGETITHLSNWNRSYNGDQYLAAKNKSVDTPIYVDQSQILYFTRDRGVPLYLLEGFGFSMAYGPHAVAENLGNENTIIYHRYDLGRGNTPSILEEYTHPNAQGKYEYTPSVNGAFQKLIAYLPVMLSDEESGLGTVEADCGNALIYRTGLGSGWGTMVLPYSMTADQLKEAFGDDVKVANLTAVEGTVLKFDETTLAVTGGEPFLIKGVTKTGPFVAKGITDFVSESSKNVDGIDFIGTYSNMGSTAFTTKDYFFVASSDKLTRVSRSGMKMVLKGYRAYFHDSSSAGAKSFTVSIGDNEATGIDNIVEEEGNHDVYDLQGRKVASGLSWNEAKRLLRQGVYIVNGKRMIVK